MSFFRRHRSKIIALALGAGLELIITNGEDINIIRMIDFMVSFVLIVFFYHGLKKLARRTQIEKIRHPVENLEDLENLINQSTNDFSRYPPYVLGEPKPPNGSRTDYGFRRHKPPEEEGEDDEENTK